MPTPSNPTAALRFALDLTAIPTAAGREWRVITRIEQWCAERPDITLTRDSTGNLILAHREAPAPSATPPLFITAHLDHPAFVIDSAPDASGSLTLNFRGGVRDFYFASAPITIHTRDDRTIHATLTSAGPADPFRPCTATLDPSTPAPARKAIAPGDIARWALPDPAITNHELHTHACDDLAAAAAALCAFDALRTIPAARHVRLLFTRAEEIGFTGAIAACKNRTLPPGSRTILLENSRSFPHDSPIGAGPIVRVGDRLTTFSPTLTAAIAKVAADLAAQREKANQPPFRWQRKLMPGGACESTVYQAFGYESSCICLPLGNYHNMADLAAVESNDPAAVARARCGREHISTEDYLGLIDLLIACGTSLGTVEPILDRLESLYAKTSHVLAE